MSSARARKRYIIAAAVLAGVKVAVTARESQISRSWASREANALETRQLLRKMASDPKLVDRLLVKVTEAIVQALRAEKEYRADGQIIDRTPDYRKHLQACTVTLRLVERHARFGVRLAQMDPLLDESWRHITDALGAEKVLHRNRQMITLGPDHWVRLNAAELASEFMEKIDWKPAVASSQLCWRALQDVTIGCFTRLCRFDVLLFLPLSSCGSDSSLLRPS